MIFQCSHIFFFLRTLISKKKVGRSHFLLRRPCWTNVHDTGYKSSAWPTRRFAANWTQRFRRSQPTKAPPQRSSFPPSPFVLSINHQSSNKKNQGYNFRLGWSWHWQLSIRGSKRQFSYSMKRENLICFSQERNRWLLTYAKKRNCFHFLLWK